MKAMSAQAALKYLSVLFSTILFFAEVYTLEPRYFLTTDISEKDKSWVFQGIFKNWKKTWLWKLNFSLQSILKQMQFYVSLYRFDIYQNNLFPTDRWLCQPRKIMKDGPQTPNLHGLYFSICCTAWIYMYGSCFKHFSSYFPWKQVSWPIPGKCNAVLWNDCTTF